MTLRRLVKELIGAGAIDLTKLDSDVIDRILTLAEKSAIGQASDIIKLGIDIQRLKHEC